MTKQADQYYIHQIISGNTGAFAVLVDRYKMLVFTLASKMITNREEAEEVAQDAFIKAFNSLGKFKGDSKFSTWLYRIAYNTCLDRLKKNKKEENVVPVDEFTASFFKTTENAFEALVEQERKQLIQDCLQQLPGEEGFLLTLYYFEDQNLDEIAKIMDITANHVKVKLFRSRKKLAGILKRHLEPETLDYYERER
jgi:RNA polymerase sigma factor (sigma-70 family)